jgi:hypothetical protein
VIVLNAGTAVGAFFRVDNIGFFTFGNSAGGAFEGTPAALDAIFGDFISHGGLLKAAGSIASIYIIQFPDGS